MRRGVISLLLCAALLLSLAGCGGGQDTGPDPQGGSSASGTDQEPTGKPVDIPFTLAAYPAYSFHPVLGGNRANLTLAPLLYEPLFQVDETFQAVPVLCQSVVSSEDKLSWTFTLRPGITFSDGTPLTGDIVAAALNAARQTGSRYAQRLSAVSAITAGEGSVTVTLSRPNGSLPLLLDIPIASGTGERPAGTGPYVLSGTGEDLSLTARTGWWQDKPLPAREIPLSAAVQSDDLISSFASGGIGLVDVDLMGTNSLGYSGSYETWDYATTDFLYLGFNTQSGLCRSAQVRRALSKAVDRDSIIQVDYARHAVAASLPLHPASSVYDLTLAQAARFDPDQMAGELEEAGAMGRPLVLLVNSENPAKAAAAQRIAYQLEAAGMEVTVSKLAFDDYTAALSQGSFDLYLGEVVLTADFDLSVLLSSGGGLNYGGWRDEPCDILLSALRSAEGEDRRPAASALFAYLSEQAPITPICFKNGSVLTQWGRLSGLAPVRGNVFYQLENWIIQ